MADTKSIWITVLALVVVIMAIVLIYAFVIQPAISGYTVQKQQQGVQIAVNAILTQIQQNGYVAIPIGNQTLYLAPFNPQQLQQQQQAAQVQQTTPTQNTTPAA